MRLLALPLSHALNKMEKEQRSRAAATLLFMAER